MLVKATAEQDNMQTKENISSVLAIAVELDERLVFMKEEVMVTGISVVFYQGSENVREICGGNMLATLIRTVADSFRNWETRRYRSARNDGQYIRTCNRHIPNLPTLPINYRFGRHQHQPVASVSCGKTHHLSMAERFTKLAWLGQPGAP